MPTKISFFNVGNGDMSLIKLENTTTILIDCNIRKPDTGVRDVAKDLRELLAVDEKGRPYVDVMVLSHPDQDHCRGLREHFHLGPITDYCNKEKGEKIIIKEMWSSPLVFRRSSRKNHTLCEDAQAWNAEARRRVNLYKKKKFSAEGDRILILSEDENGKTDDILEIVAKEGRPITAIGGVEQNNFSALLLAPLMASDSKEDELLSKNESSVIINYSLGAGRNAEAVRYLSGGDAEVAIWEKLWSRHKENRKSLQYNLLLAPHHCSWHSLSYDSWSKSAQPKVSKDARDALAQALPGAVIVASSDLIMDDDVDPPCIGAKNEYVSITNAAKGSFWNTSDHLSEAQQRPIIFEVVEGGLRHITNNRVTTAGKSSGALGIQPLAHGDKKSCR